MNASKQLTQLAQLNNSAQILYAVLLLNYVCWAIFPPARGVCIVFLLVYLLACRPILTQFRITWPLLIFIIFASLALLTSASGAWDARSIWLFHAKKIFIDNSLYAQLDNYGDSHSDYPVIVPAFSAMLAKIVGHWNEVFPKTSSLFFLLPPLLVAINLLRNTTLFLLLLIGLGAICGAHLFDGYMDAILALYVGIAFIGLFQLGKPSSENGQSDISAFSLAAFPIIILPLIKNEGLFSVLILLIAACLLSRDLRKKAILLGFLAVMLYMLSWKWPTLAAHLHNDFLDGNYQERLINRLSSVHDWQTLFTYVNRSCGIGILAVLIMAVLNRAAWALYRFCLIFLCLYIGFIAMVYMVTPLEFEFHLITSANRVLMPINVVALMTCLYSLRNMRLGFISGADRFIGRRSLLARVALQVIGVLAILGLVFVYLKTPVELNQTISFKKNGNGVAYLQEIDLNPKRGWGHPEEWGVWMNGSSASVVMPNPNFPSAQSIELVLQPFQYPSHLSQEVTIYVNGQGNRVLVGKAGSRFMIPLAVTYPWQSTIHLKFETQNAKRPSDLGLGNDGRLLSIGLVSITFR